LKIEGVILKMANYSDLDIKPIINAAGTYTRYGGSLVDREVIAAMEQAAGTFVDIDRLLKKSGQYIAELLDVEAALVTSGAAAGIVLASAACMAGKDKQLMASLPDTEGIKNEFIIMKCHRNPYDRSVKLTGAEFVEIGDAIETSLWELQGAVGENTAGVIYSIQSSMLEASLPLKQVIEAAHEKELPVIVDAAAEIPPAENLTKFTELGADLVLFSGGKELRGPQSSGLITGRKNLIEACRLNGFPHHTVGRPMKLDKETIMGFVRALELYLKEDHNQRAKRWTQQVDYMVGELEKIPVVTARKGFPSQPLVQPPSVPRVYVNFKSKELDKEKAQEKLSVGEPRIVVVTDRNSLILNPHMLQEGEEKIVIKKLKRIIAEYS